jgi:prepilin-type N-terminal cleavage/methylation domain-containing protein
MVSNKKAVRGFTLIEILVVIGIIAILAAVVLIAINPARQFAQANNSQRTSNVNAILNAIGQYSADNHGDLTALGLTNTYAEIDDGLCDALVPTYLPAMPTDPLSDSEGAAIEEADCEDIGTGDVEYRVRKDSTTNRVSVDAPNTELISPDIEVTR